MHYIFQKKIQNLPIYLNQHCQGLVVFTGPEAQGRTSFPYAVHLKGTYDRKFGYYPTG